MSRWMILAPSWSAAARVVACRLRGCDRLPGRTLHVVATTGRVADFASNVGGDRVQVTSLLKPHLDAHDYEPSPADVEAIARAEGRPGKLAARHHHQLRL